MSKARAFSAGREKAPISKVGAFTVGREKASMSKMGASARGSEKARRGKAGDGVSGGSDNTPMWKPGEVFLDGDVGTAKMLLSN
jgi:hypothetical protein